MRERIAKTTIAEAKYVYTLSYSQCLLKYLRISIFSMSNSSGSILSLQSTSMASKHYYANFSMPMHNYSTFQL